MIVGHIAARRMGRGAYFEFQKLLEIHVASGDDKAPLLHDIGTPLKKSLYEFKAKFFELLEAAYTKGTQAGEVELFADRPDAMRFRILIQDEPWQPELENALR
jgi:hypothetical protein